MKSSAASEAIDTVRTLWHGSPLSIWEELSLRSFLRCGHDVEVYSYEPLAVPDGVTWIDANEVLPESEVFAYSDGPAKGSFAAFSNLFRIKLLYERGGIWADSDFLCLKPLHELPAACVGDVFDNWPNGALMRFPASHPVCGELFERVQALGPNIFLGQMSELITELVVDKGGDCESLPVNAFYPIPWKETWRLVDPDQREHCERQAESSYAVHWWNTAISMVLEIPKEALSPIGSYLYEHALPVLGRSDLPAWPVETVRPWIDQFRANHDPVDESSGSGASE